MALHEVRTGLWHWQAPHPEWAPGTPWPQEVSSYAIDDGERLLLFDPLAVPDELLARAPERRPVIWLRDGGAEVHWYGDGDRLPMGIEGFAGREHNDLVLWPESARAIIAGDTLVDFGAGFRLAEWLRGGSTAQAVAAGLRPLLERPVEVVCPVHGTPTDRAALERALALQGDGGGCRAGHPRASLGAWARTYASSGAGSSSTARAVTTAGSRAAPAASCA